MLHIISREPDSCSLSSRSTLRTGTYLEIFRVRRGCNGRRFNTRTRDTTLHSLHRQLASTPTLSMSYTIFYPRSSLFLISFLPTVDNLSILTFPGERTGWTFLHCHSGFIMFVRWRDSPVPISSCRFDKKGKLRFSFIMLSSVPGTTTCSTALQRD